MNMIKAIAVFPKNENRNGGISGSVLFIEEGQHVKIDINLTGLKPNSEHGFHVHAAGDLTDNCNSMCAHFNPYNMPHGCPGMKKRHVGDLGNIKTDKYGCAKYSFYDNVIQLRGTKRNILGRGLIIHENKDDCGQGNNIESLKTGNAGKRIACAVIGYARTNDI